MSSVLRDKVAVRGDGGLGEACRAGGGEICGGRVCRGGEVVEAYPVFLAMLEEVGPALKARRERLGGLCVEDPYVGVRDIRVLCCFEEWPQKFRLAYEEPRVRYGDVVTKFKGRVAGVRTGEDSSRAGDGEKQDWVIYVVERVDENTVPSFHTSFV